METRSNHVLVGAVVLILLIATAICTVWLARSSLLSGAAFVKNSISPEGSVPLHQNCHTREQFANGNWH